MIPGGFLAQDRPDPIDEKSIRDNIWKMSKRPDEKQPLPWAFDFRNESIEVHAVGDDVDVGSGKQRAILFRHNHHFAIAPNPSFLEPPPAPIVPALCDSRRSIAYLPVQRERHVVFHQDVAGVRREHGVLYLHGFDFIFGSNAAERAQHRGRLEFVYFRRRERGPARLTITGLIDEDQASTKIQHGPKITSCLGVAECEQKNVELAGHFAQQIEDPHCAPVRERKREIGADDRDTAAARGQRAACDLLDLGRINRTIFFPRYNPLRTQEDAVDWHAPYKQQRSDCGANGQMMPFQPRVIRQNFRGCPKKRRTPYRGVSWIAIQQ